MQSVLKVLLTCGLGALLAAGSAADPAKDKADIEKLQGSWSFSTLEVEGTKLGDTFLKACKITVKGDTFTAASPMGTDKGTFKLDASKSPRTLDLTFTEGPDKGGVSLAIYELDGDAWKVCLGFSGKDRPKSFETAPGRGCALESLKREPEADPVKRDLALLEGEWRMVSGERGGEALPANLVESARRVSKDGETTASFGGQVFLKATYKLDPTKKPKTIDYAVTEGPLKGMTQLGIYEVEGDTARFCFTIPGNERPTEFATKAGDGITLSVWKRDKK